MQRPDLLPKIHCCAGFEQTVPPALQGSVVAGNKQAELGSDMHWAVKQILVLDELIHIVCCERLLAAGHSVPPLPHGTVVGEAHTAPILLLELLPPVVQGSPTGQMALSSLLAQIVPEPAGHNVPPEPHVIWVGDKHWLALLTTQVPD